MTARRVLAAAATLAVAAVLPTCGFSGGTEWLPECPVDALDDWKPGDDPVEVVVWAAYVAKPAETLQALVDKYNDSQDKVRVTLDNQGTSYEELLKKYTSAIPSRDLPAIAILEDTVTQFMADSATVVPAQLCIEADDYDTSDLLETGVNYYSIDGDLYPGSLNMSTVLFYYNKNHFRRAGLDPEKTPQNLAELREYAEKIKAEGIVDKPLVLKMSPWTIEYWLTGDDVTVVNNDNGRCCAGATEGTMKSKEAIEVFQWLRDMYDDGLLNAIPDTDGQADHYFAMATQVSSMSVETSAAATSIASFLKGDLDTGNLGGPEVDGDELGLDIGAGMIPGLREAGQVQIGGGAWYMTNTPEPEVQAGAWDFIKFINEPENQVEWNLVGSYLPFNTKAVEDPRLQEEWKTTISGQWLALAYEELTEGINPDFPGPLIGPYLEFRKAVRGALDAMVFEDASPEKALTTADKQITDDLRKYEDENF